MGPWLEHGVGWQTIWHGLGIASLVVGVLLFVFTPSGNPTATARSDWAYCASLLGVFRNPQSYLCGIVAGLLFVPTTIGDMTWGVAFFQRDRMVQLPRCSGNRFFGSVGLGDWLSATRLARGFCGPSQPVLIGGAVAMLCAAGITFSTGHTAYGNRLLLIRHRLGRTDDSVHHRQGSESDEVKGALTGESTYSWSDGTDWTHFSPI